MPSKAAYPIAFLLALIAAPAQAELATLFTTPQERQIINANRYKSDDPKPVQPVDDSMRDLAAQQVPDEEVAREYQVSGITVSPEGAHSVWIDSKRHEDGDLLDGKSRIKVLVGDEIRVRITAPDGRHYFGVSGEKIRFTYLAPAEN